MSTTSPQLLASRETDQSPHFWAWSWWDLLLIVPVGLLIWLGTIWLPSYRYQINPDGVCYMSIAQKYLHGHFRDAVNAYWSPLYCWLLAAFLACGVAPVLATKLLGLVTGGATLLGLWRLAGNLAMGRMARLVLGCAMVPGLVYFGLFVITPDLLVACMLVFYLSAITHPRYLERKRHAVFTGLLAALAYFAKAYALPFVLGHFLLVQLTLVCGRRAPGERWRAIRNAVIGLAVFAAVSAPWVAALTIKYHRFMTGSSGTYNYALNGPRSRGQYMHYSGFLAPPNDTAVNAWEDPTDFPMVSWSALDSDATWQHQQRLLTRNFNETLKIAEGFTWLLYPILFAAVLWGQADPRPMRPGMIVLLAVLLYPSGYYLLHTEMRFLMLVYILLAVLGMFIEQLARTGIIPDPARRLIALLIIGASFVPWAWNELPTGRQTGEGMAQEAQRLSGVLPAGARIASDDGWDEALYLSFYLDWRYYNTARPGSSPGQIQRDLQRLPVEYFLTRNNPDRYPMLAGLPDLVQGKVAGLRIYKLPTTREGTAPAKP